MAEHLPLQQVQGRLTVHGGGDVLAAGGGHPVHGVGAVFQQDAVVVGQSLLGAHILGVDAVVGGLGLIQTAVLLEHAEVDHNGYQRRNGQNTDEQGPAVTLAVLLQVQVDAGLLGALYHFSRGRGSARIHGDAVLFRDHCRPPLSPSSTPPMARRYIHGSSRATSSPSSSWAVCRCRCVVSASA